MILMPKNFFNFRLNGRKKNAPLVHMDNPVAKQVDRERNELKSTKTKRLFNLSIKRIFFNKNRLNFIAKYPCVLCILSKNKSKTKSVFQLHFCCGFVIFAKTVRP